MGILIADNFNYKGKKPLDERIVYDLLSDMKAVADSIIYEGAIAYCKEDKKFYTFDPANIVDATTGKWRELQLGGTGNTSIEDYTQDTQYKKNGLLLYNNKIYLVTKDFTSDNTQTLLEDSFNLDLTASNFVPVDTDTNCVEYKQNQKYTKDSLVYLGNKIGRVEKDFTSDNTEADIKESFKIDTGATGAILLISGEASDPTLTEDIKSNVEAGNIKINDLIKIGTTFTDFVKKLLIKEILPTGKITAFKSGLNLKGTTVTTPLITAEILTLGDATIDTIEFYRGTNLEDTQTYVTGTNIYTFNTTDISSNETVSIKIHYTHKDGITKDTLTYSVNYTFVNYSYFGLTNGIPTDTDIIGLSSNLKNTKAFTGTVNPVNQHIVYAYPEHLGSLTSIKDQNGFDYIAGSYTNVTMIINGENYKVYYLTNPTTNNGIKQIYS